MDFVSVVPQPRFWVGQVKDWQTGEWGSHIQSRPTDEQTFYPQEQEGELDTRSALQDSGHQQEDWQQSTNFGKIHFFDGSSISQICIQLLWASYSSWRHQYGKPTLPASAIFTGAHLCNEIRAVDNNLYLLELVPIIQLQTFWVRVWNV